ncbi:MAG: peptidoglycan D,D-transpeptidase FtsI family protein [Gammaproteobacteria bacterium]
MNVFETKTTEVKNLIKKLNIRSWIIVSAFGVLATGLAWRLFDLHVLNQQFLRTQGDARTVRTIPIPAHRGIIADRNGEPLAVSAPVASIWVNPQQFVLNDTNVQLLAEKLGLESASLQKRLEAQADKEFVYLKRQVAPQQAQQVQTLNLPGIFVEREYRRYYPTGEVTAHVLGVTDIDGQGQEGVEFAFDENLSGAPGARSVMKDRLGRVVDEIQHLRDPKPGENLYLSIDRRVQYLAYLQLLNAVSENQAGAGSIVVLNVKTGEILAMVNYPSFNPNNRLDRGSESQRNRAVTDVFEPGSVMKTFSMAAAMAYGSVQPETLVDTNPGTFQLRGKTIKDVNNYGVIDMTGVLKHSSNIGITHAMLATPFENYLNLLQKIGFGMPTSSGFPGERSGEIQIPREHDDFSKATMSFGYGLSVTTLQLAQSYAVIANDGNFVPVTFLRTDQTPDMHGNQGEQVLEPELARQLQTMLTRVVHDERGTFRAKIAGYRVAGKSGTARKATAEGGYEAKRYISVFAGFAPASQPQIATVVVIDDPQAGDYYGGKVAAPIFSKVTAGTLRLLNIQPDFIEDLQKDEEVEVQELPEEQALQLAQY